MLNIYNGTVIGFENTVVKIPVIANPSPVAKNVLWLDINDQAISVKKFRHIAGGRGLHTSEYQYRPMERRETEQDLFCELRRTSSDKTHHRLRRFAETRI